MKTKRLLPTFAAVAFFSVIAFATLRSGPSPTEEERKQMDILSGQRFVCQKLCPQTYTGPKPETVEIKKARSIAEFDGQHEAIPYLRLVSHLFERYDWPKDRSVDVYVLPLGVTVIWPLSPEDREIRDNGIWPFLHRAIIYTNDMSMLVEPEDYEADMERRGVPREKWY